VFTAREVAVESHVPERQLAKVLAVEEEGGGHLMVVLPVPCRVDLSALKAATKRHRLSLVHEEDMARLFPDCEVGAMPPFGRLYGMPVYVDACFPLRGEIVFRGGKHREVVRMAYADYVRLAGAVAGEYCLHERDKDVSA
jgi:Ala-tRNA(Pro) deacylase